MRQIKTGMVLLVGAVLVFLGADSICSGIALYIVKGGAFLLSCASLYPLFKGWEEKKAEERKQDRADREELTELLRTSFSELSELLRVQAEVSKNANRDVIEPFVKRIDEIHEVQKNIVENERHISESNGQLYGKLVEGMERIAAQNSEMKDIVDAIKAINEEFFVKAEKELESRAEKEEDLLEDLRESLAGEAREAFQKQEAYISTIKDHVETIKALEKDFLDKTKERLGSCETKLTERLGDMKQDLTGIVNKSFQKQEGIYEKLSELLAEQMERMEQILTQEYGGILEKNKELTDYLKAVQEEWTSLNKTELDFLNKVWNKK